MKECDGQSIHPSGRTSERAAAGCSAAKEEKGKHLFAEPSKLGSIVYFLGTVERASPGRIIIADTGTPTDL